MLISERHKRKHASYGFTFIYFFQLTFIGSCPYVRPILFQLVRGLGGRGSFFFSFHRIKGKATVSDLYFQEGLDACACAPLEVAKVSLKKYQLKVTRMTVRLKYSFVTDDFPTIANNNIVTPVHPL